jgi:hypothetical protein
MPSHSIIRAGIVKASTVAAIVLWIAVVGMGARTLLRYANTPSRETSPPTEWPIGSALRPAAGHSTLLVFAHPECPCTRATLGELALVITQVRGSSEILDTYVVFSAAATVLDAWDKTGLWDSAVNIPRVRGVVDRGGVEARRFHATTSGQTLLYNARRRLLFSGGITASRGHAGPNDGHDALVALLGGGVMRGASWRRTTPVFGCSLLGEESP